MVEYSGGETHSADLRSQLRHVSSAARIEYILQGLPDSEHVH